MTFAQSKCLRRCGFLLALAMVFNTPALAAEHWSKLPTIGYTLNNKQDAISFIDARTGWYGNGTGALYATRDGGDHWTLVSRRRGTYIRALAFSDARTGFIGNVGPGYFPGVSDKTPLYVTRDGGASWQAAARASGPVVTGVCAIDILRIDGAIAAIRAGGRVGGPAGLLESFDKGLTWHARDLSAVTGMILDIRFVDAQTGFIAGASEADESKARARILKTVDGGKTWRVVYESDRAGDNNWKLAFPSARVGYATIISYDAPKGEPRGYVAKTEDGGETWSKLDVTKDAEWNPYGIAFLDDAHGFVGGSTGGYETRDGGRTWETSDMGRSVNKFSIMTQADGRRVVFAIGAQVSRLVLPAVSPSEGNR